MVSPLVLDHEQAPVRTTPCDRTLRGREALGPRTCVSLALVLSLEPGLKSAHFAFRRMTDPHQSCQSKNLHPTTCSNFVLDSPRANCVSRKTPSAIRLRRRIRATNSLARSRMFYEGSCSSRARSVKTPTARDPTPSPILLSSAPRNAPRKAVKRSESCRARARICRSPRNRPKPTRRMICSRSKTRSPGQLLPLSLQQVFPTDQLSFAINSFPFYCLAKDKRGWWAATCVGYAEATIAAKGRNANNGPKRKFKIEYPSGESSVLARSSLLFSRQKQFSLVKVRSSFAFILKTIRSYH